MFSKQLLNILMLGISFMLVFVSFQTMGNILQTIIHSVKKDYPDYQADPLTALAIIYVVFALSNFIAPSVIGALGPKISMICGALTYMLYIASFTIVETWVLYIVSFILGIGAAVIWTAQGTYLTQNSNSTTMSTNSGIFWALFQCSLLFGNLFVFFAFQDKTEIDQSTRSLIYNVLTGVAILGIAMLCLLRPSLDSDGEVVHNINDGVINGMKRALLKFIDGKILLLCFSFWATGTLLTFAGSIYSPAIGSTLMIAQDPKKFVGLSGILFGVGEVTGGGLFGLLGSRTAVWGRSPIILLGTSALTACYCLVYVNLPDAAAFGDTSDPSPYLGTPVLGIALLCSFLLGFGDSCFQTQIYSIVGTLYKDDSAPAFAIFKFVQSVATGIAFLYSGCLGLHMQMYTLIIQIIVAAFTFIIVERKAVLLDSTEKTPEGSSSTHID